MVKRKIDKKTSITIKTSTLEKLISKKVHPRETHEDVLLRILK